jgi:tRNA-specific 2-thiouridylase
MSASGRERVLVAMSGGVDSSVAAALLREAGHDVTGVTLKLWGGESDSGCCSVADVEDARRVAAQLDIPHYVFNFTDDFEASVVTPYTDAYAAGRTPNPCVECNRTMKFGRLLDRARAMGFDAVATGHHARIGRGGDGRPVLRRGADDAKDQSYVLYMLGEEDLGRVRLPVGELTKAEVREHARRLGLRTADKRESMDVCFITKHGKEAFLGARIPRAPGEVVTTAGDVVGTHSGVDAFTIGQRRGLGVAVGERRFVVDVDAMTRTVTLGEREELLRDELPVVDPTFSRAAPAPDEEVLVQVRAHGTPFTGRWFGDRVVCDQPQPRVAPGQVIALYRGDVLLGGGIAA